MRHELQIDDLIFVDEQAIIPSDGIVHSAVNVNEAIFSGESRPVYKSPEDQVGWSNKTFMPPSP